MIHESWMFVYGQVDLWDVPGNPVPSGGAKRAVEGTGGKVPVQGYFYSWHYQKTYKADCKIVTSENFREFVLK
jgi:hypothetical protein